MDLAAIRVKVQRLSDDLAAALVSLEELVLVPTAVVRVADCQTEMVASERFSMAVQTPLTIGDIKRVSEHLHTMRQVLCEDVGGECGSTLYLHTRRWIDAVVTDAVSEIDAVWGST